MRERPKCGGPAASRRSVMLGGACLLGGLAIRPRRAAAQIADTGCAASSVAPRPQCVPTFPLAVRPGQRYLEDAAGKPFLIHGDTAWSLIADLTREDVEHYLDDRRARGFNTILVELIEHRFSSNAPANAYGELPFSGQPFEAVASLASLIPENLAYYGTSLATLVADYSMPNEAYFTHADWVLRQAAARGMLVLLTPSYLGYGGGADGWYRAMVANGPERLRQYGEFLGRRYRDLPNILWVHAGDYNPPRKDLVRAIAEGIAVHDPRALHTAHGAPETAAIEYWQDEPWLQVNNIYTYGSVHAAALEQYTRAERMPFFLIESAYENPTNGDEWRLRVQAYQALLSGAAGHVFGNDPIWHFDGPGIEPPPMNWRAALGSRGALSMSHLAALFFGLPWWVLAPDFERQLLVDGHSETGTETVAAVAHHGQFAVVYLPTDRTITIALMRLVGPRVRARWYDPSSGQFIEASGSPFLPVGTQPFRPGRKNSAGYGDWVLVLESLGAKGVAGPPRGLKEAWRQHARECPGSISRD